MYHDSKFIFAKKTTQLFIITFLSYFFSLNGFASSIVSLGGDCRGASIRQRPSSSDPDLIEFIILGLHNKMSTRIEGIDSKTCQLNLEVNLPAGIKFDYIKIKVKGKYDFLPHSENSKTKMMILSILDPNTSWIHDSWRYLERREIWGDEPRGLWELSESIYSINLSEPQRRCGARFVIRNLIQSLSQNAKISITKILLHFRVKSSSIVINPCG